MLREPQAHPLNKKRVESSTLVRPQIQNPLVPTPQSGQRRPRTRPVTSVHTCGLTPRLANGKAHLLRAGNAGSWTGGAGPPPALPPRPEQKNKALQGIRAEPPRAEAGEGRPLRGLPSSLLQRPLPAGRGG